MDKEAKARIQRMRKQIRTLEYEIHEEVDRHIGRGIPTTKTGLGYELDEPQYDDAQWFYVSDEWDCPESPFGWCMYHIVHDRIRDNCVFCHQPKERK